MITFPTIVSCVNSVCDNYDLYMYMSLEWGRAQLVRFIFLFVVMCTCCHDVHVLDGLCVMVCT